MESRRNPRRISPLLHNTRQHETVSVKLWAWLLQCTGRCAHALFPWRHQELTLNDWINISFRNPSVYKRILASLSHVASMNYFSSSHFENIGGRLSAIITGVLSRCWYLLPSKAKHLLRLVFFPFKLLQLSVDWKDQYCEKPILCKRRWTHLQHGLSRDNMASFCKA